MFNLSVRSEEAALLKQLGIAVGQGSRNCRPQDNPINEIDSETGTEKRGWEQMALLFEIHLLTYRSIICQVVP